MKKIIVGIDPDLIKNGMAVVVDKKIVSLEAVSFHNLIEFLEAVGPKESIDIKLENPDSIKPLFGSKVKNKRAVREKICQDVGKVKAVGILINEYLLFHGYSVRLIRPLRGPIKRQAKADKIYFNKVTGWKGGSSEDKRDAALIALWG